MYVRPDKKEQIRDPEKKKLKTERSGDSGIWTPSPYDRRPEEWRPNQPPMQSFRIDPHVSSHGVGLAGCNFSLVITFFGAINSAIGVRNIRCVLIALGVLSF